MGILLVSSAPIELLQDYEIKTGEESTEKIAHAYGPARREPYTPPNTTQRLPVGAPRRYEPRPVVYRHGKPCLLHLVPEQKEEV